MATGGDLSRTLEGGHEPFYDFPCFLCEKDGRHVEAVRYCEECFVYMCDPCVRNHNKFPLNTSHQLLDQSQFVRVAQSKPVSFPAKRCLKHPGELVNIYCGNHDVVCCSSCKVLEHSNCANTKHLADAAKGILNSQQYQTVKQDIRDFLGDVVRVSAGRRADISRIENEKRDVKQVIADFRKTVNMFFDDLEQRSLDELNSKADDIIRCCNKDTKDLDVMKSKAEAVLKQLDLFKGDNECDLFVQVKAGKQFIVNYMQEVTNISNMIQTDAIDFRLDPKIERYLSSFEVLGTFGDIQMNASQLRTPTPTSQTSPDDSYQLPKYSAQLYGEFDVKEKSDSDLFWITSICPLPDGTILIADCGNKKLKRLDRSYKLLDSLQFPVEPHSICHIGSDEVAVSLCNKKKVQYINVKRELRLTRSFRTGNYCRGMVYVDDKLYVCCGSMYDLSSGCIEVYNNASKLIHSFTGLAFVPLCITVTDDGQHLLVTSQPGDNITMMDLTGNIVNTFSNKNLKGPRGICTDGKVRVFICGITSNTVVQLEPKQQKIEVILGENDGIKEPCAIYYDIHFSRLLIVSKNSNKLLVFNLK